MNRLGSYSKQAIDFSRPFMPEQLTPLFYTNAYQSLSAPQRLRYNQLNALYFNEQIMFFERALAHNIIGQLLLEPLPAELKRSLHQFLTEEEQHSAMFLGLNQRCAPTLYARQAFHFIQVPRMTSRLLNLLSRRPRWFPLFIWLMHLQEERALFYGRAFLQAAVELEPNFVATQRKHLADEIGHVRWDEALLDWLWPRTNPILRRLNARFLGWMIGNYFSAPKRSALRVLAALAQEFPELCAKENELRRQLLALGDDPRYRRFLYSPENVPATIERFNAWPEFASLAKVIPGYVPSAMLAT